MSQYITEDIESFSDEYHNKISDEENSDEENSDEENSE